MKPKIFAYVQQEYSKQSYKNECMDSRHFVGLRVIIDVLERNGYEVDYAGIETVHNYDFVLVSLTADCDWWTYISERLKWRKGNYKVIVGGAGLLHISPFLPFGDIFIWGRGENVIIDIINGSTLPQSATDATSFSEERKYYIAQADKPYPYPIKLSENRIFQEDAIGCNHKCLFCGYTWHRKFNSNNDYYVMSLSLFGTDMSRTERALLDMSRDYNCIDFNKLRTTAIDGFSERLRYSVNKKINRELLLGFFNAMTDSVRIKKIKPHQIKLYNICGYPTEKIDDMQEFTETLREADRYGDKLDKQWSIVLHNTPFRAMPATPMACAPMSYQSYRGKIAKFLRDKLYKGNILFQGRNFWAVESMGTDSLSTVILSAIAHRGERDDTENIVKLCSTPTFWRASSGVKQATLEKYFNVGRLFSEFTVETLPSRYLRTYAKVESFWPKAHHE